MIIDKADLGIGTESPWEWHTSLHYSRQRLGRCKPCKIGFTWDDQIMGSLRAGVFCPACENRLTQTTALFRGPWYGLFA